MSNPFTDEIQITFAHSPEHQPKSITLFSATGEMIIKLKNPDYSVTHLDLGNLSSGMYLLVIESNTGIQSLKLSKE
ncbi:MAG: T9SS type A sorting domain-containing protein [Flavobacteriales bacterium]|nr:T9SS type A sorting domain-containing protein [Flavobacteriales bacterium]